MYNKAFETFASADYARAEQNVRYQAPNGKDHTFKLPPNSPMQVVDVPDYTWVRQVLFLKDADPAAPNYYLIRDDFLSDDPLPGEWNIWALAKSVDVTSTPAVVTGKYGVDMDVFLASPANPQWSTQQIEWKGDGLSFSGTAGAIRKTGDDNNEKYEVIFMAPGKAT